jgi:hypothetical protein
MFAEISGFLFLLIIVILAITTSRYGYEIFSELDSDAKLQEINKAPNIFRTSVLLVVFEHVVIVTLAITLFVAFSQYNMILGIVWVCARGLEGLIQISNKKNYWGLLDIARQYSRASGSVKDTLVDSGLSILKSKNSTFSIAQILFSVGTLAYSIVFAIYGVIPEIIGWFGVVASIIYGFGNGIARLQSNSRALWNIGGLLIWIFELVLGGWLLFSPIIPW